MLPAAFAGSSEFQSDLLPKKGANSSPLPPAELFCPIFVIVGGCTSPEVPVLADPGGSWLKSLREKWGCKNGREIGAGR